MQFLQLAILFLLAVAALNAPLQAADAAALNSRVVQAHAHARRASSSALSSLPFLPFACRCIATEQQVKAVTLHTKACGPAVDHLKPGQRYDTVTEDAAAPVVACGRRWVALRVDSSSSSGSNVLLWTAAEQLFGVCDCDSDSDAPQPLLAANGPSNELIRCLCVVESNCNRNIGCQPDQGSDSCGPYQIKRLYWVDGGSLGKDWKSCTTGPNNMACSEQTIRNYMAKYGKFCVGPDRQPTDEDYARIHNGGPKGCRKASTLAYWDKVRACMAQLKPKRDHLLTRI